MTQELPEYPTAAQIATWRGVSPQAIRRQLKAKGIESSGEVRGGEGRPAKVYPREEVIAAFQDGPQLILTDSPLPDRECCAAAVQSDWDGIRTLWDKQGISDGSFQTVVRCRNPECALLYRPRVRRAAGTDQCTWDVIEQSDEELKAARKYAQERRKGRR